MKLAKALKVVGLMNIQFALRRNVGTGDFDIYVLEVNPRASRTVPFVAKATGTPIAKIAARLMAGEKLADFRNEGVLLGMTPDHTAVKAPVFPFNRFQNVDVLLGPEMKSTGEVMGIDANTAQAFAKSQLGAGVRLPQSGRVFISVRDEDKDALLPIAKDLAAMKFDIVATGGTCEFLAHHGIAVKRINKVLEGQPHIVDAIINGEIDLLINTTTIGSQTVKDSFSIRREALMGKRPLYTNISAAKAAVQAIRALQSGELDVASIQSYFPENLAEAAE